MFGVTKRKSHYLGVQVQLVAIPEKRRRCAGGKVPLTETTALLARSSTSCFTRVVHVCHHFATLAGGRRARAVGHQPLYQKEEAGLHRQEGHWVQVRVQGGQAAVGAAVAVATMLPVCVPYMTRCGNICDQLQ